MTADPIVRLGDPSPAAESFNVHTSKPIIGFLSKAVQPPSSIYVNVADVLQVGCATSVTNEVVTVSYRLLRAQDGVLIKGQFQLFPQATRFVLTKQEPLAEGFLLSVSCKAAVATTRGQTFVRMFLTDPVLGQGQPSYMLMADYVTTTMAPAHPNGRLLSPVEGPGLPRGLPVAAPGAGNQWSVVVPANARWILRACNFTLLTSAVVRNRNVGLNVVRGGITMCSPFALDVETASSAINFIAMPVGVQATASPLWSTIPIPLNVTLLASDTITSTVVNMDGADSFTGVSVTVEEWLDNV